MSLKIRWEYTDIQAAKTLLETSMDQFRVYVIGDANNASYEWVIKNQHGEIVGFSNDGYGQIGIAMYKGLERLAKYIDCEIDYLHEIKI